MVSAIKVASSQNATLTAVIAEFQVGYDAFNNHYPVGHNWDNGLLLGSPKASTIFADHAISLDITLNPSTVPIV